MAENISPLISDIMTAVSNCSLYSNGHEAVGQHSQKAVSRLEDMYNEDEELGLTVLGDGLLVNESPTKEQSTHINTFIRKLRRKGLDRVIFKKGVSVEELVGFISDLTSVDTTPKSTQNISVGAIEVKLMNEGDSSIAAEINQDIEKIEEVYSGIARFGTLDMIGLEDVVLSFISTLKREANVLNIVSPVKSHSDYTFTHATNVTVLSLFQAESLGIEGDLLHEIGLAGLLHDMGKMFVPPEILEKPSKLEDHEWDIMKKHTVFGAMYLSKRQDAPKMAVMAAYEHHLKYDGSGYPETKRRGKNQNIISQIISIADFFDALRTDRPYRKALAVPVVIGLMQESSGKDFNPVLVENFINTLKDIDIK
jgi:HD-GYP domain-containing protein (c-di-GMP phosphodiesterase class II)